MHNQNSELKFRFHLWQERESGHWRQTSPNFQGQNVSHTAKIGGPNLQPETENTMIIVHIEVRQIKELKWQAFKSE